MNRQAQQDENRIFAGRSARRAERLPIGVAPPQQRRRIKHEKTFQERLAEEASRFRVAQKLPPRPCPRAPFAPGQAS